MSAAQHNPSAHAHLPLAIMLLLTAFYLLTMSGHTYSPDEETMYEVTRRIALAGDVAVVVEDGAPVAALRVGADRRGYSPYGILPSLLALPLFGLGALSAPLGPAAFDYTTRLAVTALNSLVTAATAALLAAWALRLGASRRAALLLALLYGLGTFAWPYARTFFSEPLAALLLLLATERAEASRHSALKLPLLISGLAAGLLLTTRIASGIALPVIALYIVLAPRIEDGGWRMENGTARSSILHPLSSILNLGLWALGLLPGLALLAGYNQLRFGTLLATGYASESGAFTTPIAVGLYGMLLSPGKSLFLFAPPALLALPGAVLLWRAQRGVVLLALGLFLAHLLLYARWVAWNGGGVWGPRFLLPTVPLLILLASGCLKRGSLRGTPPQDPPSSILHPLSSILVIGLGALGLIGSLGGVLLNFDTYQNMPVSEEQRQYTVAGSPLVAHWRILGDRFGRYFAAGPSCALGDGLYPPEGEPGAPLPRRTGAYGELRCRLAAPTAVTLAIDDRRPPAAPPSELALQLGRYGAGPQPPGQARVYTLLLPPGRTTLRLSSSTWNPLRVGFSDRDDELGVLIRSVRLAPLDGASARLLDAAVAPLPSRPRPRWAWFYEPFNQHLADHWAWYLARSELPAWARLAVAAVICATAAALLAAAWRLCRTRTATRAAQSSA